MQQAEIIIGPTGAAWTNLIFANSGIKALTWIAKEAGDFSGYSSLAHHVNIQLDFITYKAGTQDSRGIYSAPYTIDCKEIEAWLINS
jgi:capsular polysaccharide biosynthesis protein